MIWALAGLALHVADPSARSIAIGEVRDAISSDQRVGKITSGLMCLPKGPLRWRDVARPTEDEMRAALRATLGPRDAGAAREKVDVTIVAANIRLCVAWMGLGHAPKGAGSLTIRWDTKDASGKTVATATYDEPLAIEGRDPRRDKALIVEAVARSARDQARAGDAAASR